MRFASLASGSRGNALLVESGSTLVMIDCGLTLKVAEERLGALGRSPRDLAAILVTHEHGDHVRGVAMLAKRYRIPTWMTAGTAASGVARGLPVSKTFDCSRSLAIGDITIEPFPVPHDAREPCHFTAVADGRRLGMLSDAGHVTRHIRERFAGCDALAIEFNHDLEALWAGEYSPQLKQRIASPHGHLNNGQAAELVEAVAHDALQWVVALHLSEANNSQECVRGTLMRALGERPAAAAHLATQHETNGWLEIA
ncbi:MAG TPA: MBL fold metallo-hydrolase [Gammaproteobacteria bacterium]|nr:MBL fold metallo-hydrolase [Gammaproteobacteria bacterium]